MTTANGEVSGSVLGHGEGDGKIAGTARPERTRPTPARCTEGSELLTVKQVAAMLTCGERTVYRMADTGKMPRPVKIGGLVRWPRRGVMAWIEAGCLPVRTTTHAG